MSLWVGLLNSRAEEIRGAGYSRNAVSKTGQMTRFKPDGEDWTDICFLGIFESETGPLLFYEVLTNRIGSLSQSEVLTLEVPPILVENRRFIEMPIGPGQARMKKTGVDVKPVCTKLSIADLQYKHKKVIEQDIDRVLDALAGEITEEWCNQYLALD